MPVIAELAVALIPFINRWGLRSYHLIFVLLAPIAIVVVADRRMRRPR
jgi:hypothetical protein